MAKLFFMDKDRSFDLSGSLIPITVCDLDMDKIDVIHTASNPNFSMGAGWDAFIAETYNFHPKSELEFSNKIVSLISVDKQCKATEQMVYDAYCRYFEYCIKNNLKKIGIVGLGCGVGGLTTEQTTEQLLRAITNTFCVGYKVFDKGLKCRGYQFEMNKEHVHKGDVIICNSGFHFCQKMVDCFEYYSFNSDNESCGVLGYGEFDFQGDKVCFEKIKVLEKYEWTDVLKMVNSGKENSGRGNSGHRNSGDRNSGHRNSGNRNSGDLNSGDLNSGDRNSGNRNSGNRNSGDRNSGHRNSGDRNSGDLNSGDRNSGDLNSGNRNSGNRNSGHRNSGDRNSGNRNSGHRNSGDRNSGNRNSGDRNSGNRNSGNRNSGDRNSGDLNTIKSPYRIFNKESKVEVDYYSIPGYFRFDINEWIEESSMSSEEMQNNPSYKTTGGYLKCFEYKEAFINSFNKASKEEVKQTIEIPNFKYNLFEEISGITKKMITDKLK